MGLVEACRKTSLAEVQKLLSKRGPINLNDVWKPHVKKATSN